MKLHRFYTDPQLPLEQHIWLKDPVLLKQWRKVLRFQAGQQIVLFNGQNIERLYRLKQLGPGEAELDLITELVPKTPHRSVHLLWSLLKKDKNDWVIQKCTELGVSHFWPILADRSQKTGFNLSRAERIAQEAAEQCGRSDLPKIREPLNLSTALAELQGKVPVVFCEEAVGGQVATVAAKEPVAVLIGPEGGWSEAEKQLFKDQRLAQLRLGGFTLRAETAAVAAAHRLLQ